MLEFRRIKNKDGPRWKERHQDRELQSYIRRIRGTGWSEEHSVVWEKRQSKVESGTQASTTANQSNMEVMHRRRITLGPQAAPGPCYCTNAGAAPGGWASIIQWQIWNGRLIRSRNPLRLSRITKFEIRFEDPQVAVETLLSVIIDSSKSY